MHSNETAFMAIEKDDGFMLFCRWLAHRQVKVDYEEESINYYKHQKVIKSVP